MTHQPEDRQPDDPPSGSPEAEPPLDEDAAWAAIVANYGERPDMYSDPEGGQSDDTDPGPDDEETVTRPPGGSVFDRAYLDAQRLDASSPSWTRTPGRTRPTSCLPRPLRCRSSSRAGDWPGPRCSVRPC